MFINKSRLSEPSHRHSIVKGRKNPWQLTLWKVCFSLSLGGGQGGAAQYLTARGRSSSQKNSPTSPVAVRQPDVQTTWPFSLHPPSPLEHCAGRNVGTAWDQGERPPFPADAAAEAGWWQSWLHFSFFRQVSVCWFWNWVPGKTPCCSNSSKQQQTLHSSHAFYFDRRSLISFLKGEVNMG